MTITTVPITCTFNDQNGNPIAGARVTAKLNKIEIYQGMLVADTATAVADVNGVAVLNVWPNALGTQGSLYAITAISPATGGKFMDAMVSVPNSACNLHQILNIAPYPAIDAAQQALAGAQGALALVTEQIDIATTRAGEASVSATSASEAATAASSSASSASGSATTATTQAGIATTKAVEASASAATALAAVSSQVTAVTATAPIASTGGLTPVISIAAATTSAPGSMSATDKAKLDGITGTNTGDETGAGMRTKLGVTTLSGSNTGDQTIPTTLPASDVYAWAKAAAKPAYTATEVGLGNVDNTSDATKNAATATLTNKTLTNPDINGGTVDGAVIGGAVPAVGNFTRATAYGSISESTALYSENTAADGYGAYIKGGGGIRYVAKFVNQAGVDKAEINDAGLSVTGGISATGNVAMGNGTISTGITYSIRGVIGTFSNHALGLMTNGVEQAYLDTSGNLGLGVVPSARNNTVLQIKDGIGFPSTQVTSTDPNTLDDYEEGTWTPAYATTGGSFTHVNTSGAYTKIGRKVTVQGVIETSSATVGTGEVRISGLPFTPSASLAFASRSSVGIGRATGFSGDVPCGLYVVDNSPNLWLQYRTTANGATLDLNASDLNTGAGNGLFFTATYFV